MKNLFHSGQSIVWTDNTDGWYLPLRTYVVFAMIIDRMTKGSKRNNPKPDRGDIMVV